MKLKFFSEAEFKPWRDVIMDIMIDSQLRKILFICYTVKILPAIKRRSLTAGPTAPQDKPLPNQINVQQEEEKEILIKPLLKTDIKKRVSTNSNQQTPRADTKSNSATNQASPMIPTVENEFLVNNAGESLPALKAQ